MEFYIFKINKGQLPGLEALRKNMITPSYIQYKSEKYKSKEGD